MMAFPIIICGNLSARRPGGERTRKPVRLPAERLRQAHSDFQSTGHGIRRAIFRGRRFRPCIRGRLGVGSAGWNSVSNHGQPVPLNFLGFGRALQPSEQTSRGVADGFHAARSFRDGSIRAIDHERLCSMCTNSDHPEHLVMSSADQAAGYVRRMIEHETRGWGDQDNALHRIASRYGLPFWTIQNIRSGRAKTVEASIFARIRAAYLDYCERQVRQLQHEIEIEKAKSGDADLEDLAREAEDLASRVETALARSKAP